MTDWTSKPKDETPDQELVRLRRIDEAARAFAGYAEDQEQIAPSAEGFAAVMAWCERLAWRDLSIQLYRAHTRLARREAQLASMAAEFLSIFGQVRSEPRDDAPTAQQATMARLYRHVTAAQGFAKLRPRASEQPLPGSDVANATAPAAVDAPEEQPAGIVITPTPIEVESRQLLQRAAELRREKT